MRIRENEGRGGWEVLTYPDHVSSDKAAHAWSRSTYYALETVPPCRPRSSEDRREDGPPAAAPVYCLRCRYHHDPGVDGCPSGSGRDLDAPQPAREA